MSIIDNAQVLTSEHCILACILRGDPRRDFIAEAESRGLAPEMFNAEICRELYTTSASLRADGKSPRDAAIVAERTARRTGTDADTVRKMVQEVLDAADPSDVNFVGYVDTVVDDFYKNRGLAELVDKLRMEGKDGYAIAAASQHFLDDFFRAGAGLPDFSPLESVTGKNLPPLAPEVIARTLRQGHTMILTGASKVGKSFALMGLTLAVATGREWMGSKCNKGKVLYANLEVDDASMANRFQSAMNSLGIVPDAGMVYIWNLRGCNLTKETLAKGISQRCRGEGYSLIIIDPIYKIFGGDENAADAAGRFFHEIDSIAKQTGAAVCICHHHSKGGQAGKNAMDRASGSGVFARAPDAIWDILEVEVTDEVREQLAAETGLDCSNAVGIRIEKTLREYATPPVSNAFFVYPTHIMDKWGLLDDARTRTEARATDARKRNARSGIDWKGLIDGCYDSVCIQHPEYEKTGVPSEALQAALLDEMGRRGIKKLEGNTLRRKITPLGYKSREKMLFRTELWKP